MNHRKICEEGEKALPPPLENFLPAPMCLIQPMLKAKMFTAHAPGHMTCR